MNAKEFRKQVIDILLEYREKDQLDIKELTYRGLLQSILKKVLEIEVE